MTDLVERLRKVECVERELAHDCDMPPEGTANWEYAETCKEAAYKIGRLRAALEWAAVQFANHNLPAFSHQCRVYAEGE